MLFGVVFATSIKLAGIKLSINLIWETIPLSKEKVKRKNRAF
jgi:hypothetical protein